MFEIGKTYRNKSVGTRYLILAKSISKPNYFVGENVDSVDSYEVQPYYLSEEYFPDYEKEKDKIEKWIVEFKAGHSLTYKREPVFTDEQKERIFAIKKVVFEEGEGL